MGTQAGVGMSRNRNPKNAAKEAVEIALGKANIQKPDFVLMFASVGYNQTVLLNSVRELTCWVYRNHYADVCHERFILSKKAQSPEIR